MSDTPELKPTDGGIWICETCKTYLGQIIDDDTQCKCNNYYEWEYSRYIPDVTRPDQLSEVRELVREMKEAEEIDGYATILSCVDKLYKLVLEGE